jgi:serine/threonine protein kinase
MNDIKLLLQNKLKSERDNLESCHFLVKLHGAFYEEGSVKVVLELMDLGSLRDIINMLKTTGTKEPAIEEPVLARMCQQVKLFYLDLDCIINP